MPHYQGLLVVVADQDTTPVVLPANTLAFCTEFRPELWFIGSLYANCTKAAQPGKNQELDIARTIYGHIKSPF